MSERKDRNNKLIVSFFGSFSMSYNGRTITDKAKNSENQFNYLMQLITHFPDQGVNKNTLINALFSNRDLVDPNHAIHSVMYNAKKRLESYGLPKVNYFVAKEGKYYWTKEIEIIEDVKEFEELIKEASLKEDDDEKIELLQEAVYLYQGDFLERQIGLNWITRENWRCRKLFAETVNTLAKLLKENGRYEMLERLGLYAARIQPFSDWETLTMEAFISMGKTEAAYQLFDDTIDLYLHQQGIKPSNRMFDLITKLGEQFEHSFSSLMEIQDHLKENEETRGGYLCSYPVFHGIYQAITRIAERSGQTIYLMLCTIVDTKGNILTKGEKLEELSPRLEEAIRTTIRRSDIMNKYNKGQYLVLLMNTTMENCEIIQKRIDQKFMINRQRISIRYYVNPLW
ncbi:MAG: bacterial transcriptional activator domain-containing protein [Erysipelotrichaceae bacterium]|nr:bacterial transcriptional activator domain-containing protein [Erysipelotrichaceae bacterium]MBQ3993237.1 bacterial transcriptional activator domain-containing protein [Erysipelotrichaceae bacterium]MEE3425767.1 bacterial transcriptional activator domain-containing protein [Erysipelotrichaceae bacterium]